MYDFTKTNELLVGNHVYDAVSGKFTTVDNTNFEHYRQLNESWKGIPMIDTFDLNWSVFKIEEKIKRVPYKNQLRLHLEIFNDSSKGKKTCKAWVYLDSHRITFKYLHEYQNFLTKVYGVGSVWWYKNV